MARSIHWTIPFNNINNVSCRVDIYEDNYSGSVVTLTPAVDPITIDETDDSSLLTFIRYKTGYIRIEQQEGDNIDYEAIYPTTRFSRYVEAYVGTTLVFCGYIQMEEYSQDYDTMRTIELPIASPLAYAGAIDLPNSGKCIGTSVLGVIVKNVVSTLYGTNKNVYWPKVTRNNTDINIFKMLLNNRVLWPLNEDFVPADTDSSVYSPLSPLEFIEGICTCFGWQCHDTATGIYFVDYSKPATDSSRVYYSQNSASLGFDTGLNTITSIDTELTMSDYFDSADNESTIDKSNPVKKLTQTFQGTYNGTVKPDFYNLRYRDSGYDEIGDEDDEVSAYLLLKNTNGSLDDCANMTVIDGGGVCFAKIGKAKKVDGSLSLSECILYQHFSNLIKKGFSFTFDNPYPARYLYFDMIFAYGSNYYDMGNESAAHLKIVIERDGKYYDPTKVELNPWVSTLTPIKVTINTDGRINHAFDQMDAGKTKWGGITIKSITPSPSPIKVTILPPDQKDTNEVWADGVYQSYDFELYYSPTFDEDYNTYPYKNKRITTLNADAISEENVSMLFHDYNSCRNSNSLIHYLDNSYGADKYFFGLPSYAYLGNTIYQLKTTVTQKQSLQHPHLHRWKVGTDTHDWRIIADSYNVADDTHTLLLSTTT